MNISETLQIHSKSFKQKKESLWGKTVLRTFLNNVHVIILLPRHIDQNQKRRFVLEAVRLFMRNNPTATFYDITEAFPDRLQGSYGVAKKLDWVLEKERNGFDFRVRYSMNNDEILTSYDGVRFVVSNQWGIQFYRFTEWVKNNMGWRVERV